MTIITGTSYISGDLPNVTTVDSIPVSATINVLFKDGNEYLNVKQVISNDFGEWCAFNINGDLKYTIIGQLGGYNDVIYSNITPIEYPINKIYFEDNLLFQNGNNSAGYISLYGAEKPYTLSNITGLPTGITATVNEDKIEFSGEYNSEISSNVQIEVNTNNSITKTINTKLIFGLYPPDISISYNIDGIPKIIVTWVKNNIVEKILLYKSTQIITDNNKGEPIVIDANETSYMDDDITHSSTYYYMLEFVVDRYSTSTEIDRVAEWTPNDMLNQPKIWLDWDSVVSDQNNYINAWGNKGTVQGVFIQNNQSYKPLLLQNELNGKNIIRFDGDNLQLQTTDAGNILLNAPAATVITVYKVRQNPNVFQNIIYVPGSLGVEKLLYCAHNPDGDAYIGSNQRGVYGITHKPVIDEWFIDVATLNIAEGNFSSFSNGSETASGNITPNSNNFGEASYQNIITIGSSTFNTNTDTLRGDVALVMVFNDTMTSVDRIRLEGWIAHQLDITNLLPSDHQYKDFAP